MSLKILGTGVYLPDGHLSAAEARARSSKAAGRDWPESIFDIEHRYRNRGETISQMGAAALQSALDKAGLKATELDLIMFGSSMPEQPIPCTASLVHNRLGLGKSGIACFDVSSTCTSFLTGLQIANSFAISGTYNKIGIVCAEIALEGVNWKLPETANLIGDGAAAAVFDASLEGPSKVIATLNRTYSEAVELCHIKAGGSRWNILNPPPSSDDWLFAMDGPGVFKAASKYLPLAMEEILGKARLKIDEIDWIVPHQASHLAIRHLARKLGVKDTQLINIVNTHGNQVSASLPTALHACVSEKAKRGDKILLLGTGAGLNIGMAVLEY